jgi:hypothetical protein
MPDSPSLHFDSAAMRLLELLALVEPGHRVAVIVFDPRACDGQATLYSTAGADDLWREFEALRKRLYVGTLRMPVSGGVRWVDEGEG